MERRLNTGISVLLYAVQPRNERAHFGLTGQGPIIDPQRVRRLIERTVMGEGK